MNQLLLYRNIKIILLVFYLTLGITIYLFWDSITDLWYEGLRKTQANDSIFFNSGYYFFLTTYIPIFIFMPLIIFDKSHEKEERISISWPKLDKSNSLKLIGKFLVFIFFPLLAGLGILIFALSGYVIISIILSVSLLSLGILLIYVIIKLLFGKRRE